MSQIMIGDTVRRVDEDWGNGRVIGVIVDPDLKIEFQVNWPDGPVVGWLPPEKLELVSASESSESGGALGPRLQSPGSDT